MTPDNLFSIANAMALLGWVILGGAILLAGEWSRHRPRLLAVAGVVIPTLLSIGYAALILVHFADAPGGYRSLSAVATLFQSPWLLLAGWIHYLAFDLFVGAWILRDGFARQAPRVVALAVLPATFLFGPMGLLLWLALRQAMHLHRAPVPQFA